MHCCLSLVVRADKVGHQFQGSLVHLFYGNDQPLYDEMNLASAHQGLDKLESVLSELNPQDKNVIIIDDLMQEAGQSERVRKMCTIISTQ